MSEAPANGQTWTSDVPPPEMRISADGWLRVAWKGAAVGIVTFGCLLVLLILRQIERPLYLERRPWTPHITQFVCRAALRIIGLEHHHEGQPLQGHGAMVANHASWLDIFVLNAEARIYFVSKAEVAGWPGIGWLARATGTFFIKRDPAEARRQVAEMGRRLELGQKLLFFPEGTSTDGRRVLPFRTTLFQPLVAENREGDFEVQPVTVVYHAPAGADPRIYGWWGEMEFGSHLLQTLALPRQGRVEVIYHPPMRIVGSGGRKALAQSARRVIEDTLAARIDQKFP